MFPTIAPTRFGPLARKALGRRYTKAEGDTQPEEPKAPKAEKPKEEPQTQATPAPEPLENGEPLTDTNAPNFLPQVPYGEMIPPGQVPWEGEPVGPPPEDEPPDAPEDFIREAPIEQQEPDDKEGLPQLPSLQPIQLSFYASIKENLDDETPCLIYADWLEENNQPDLAATIRSDILIESMRRDGADVGEIIREQSRSFALQEKHPEWFQPWGIHKYTSLSHRNDSGSDGSSAFMHNGLLFVNSTLPRFVRLLHHYDPNQLLANVRRLQLVPGDSLNYLRHLFIRPKWLEHIPSLGLQTIPVGQMTGFPSAIGYSGYGRNLQELYLDACDLPDEFIQDLAQAPDLRNLRVLQLNYNDLREDGIQALLDPNAFPNLRRLELLGIPLTRRDRTALQKRYGRRVLLSDLEVPE